MPNSSIDSSFEGSRSAANRPYRFGTSQTCSIQGVKYVAEPAGQPGAAPTTSPPGVKQRSSWRCHGVSSPATSGGAAFPRRTKIAPEAARPQAGPQLWPAGVPPDPAAH